MHLRSAQNSIKEGRGDAQKSNEVADLAPILIADGKTVDEDNIGEPDMERRSGVNSSLKKGRGLGSSTEEGISSRNHAHIESKGLEVPADDDGNVLLNRAQAPPAQLVSHATAKSGHLGNLNTMSQVSDNSFVGLGQSRQLSPAHTIEQAEDS